MTIDWNVEAPAPPPPMPPRPAAARSRRPRFRGRRGRTHARLVAIAAGIVVVGATVLAVADPAGRPGRPVPLHATPSAVHPLPVRWGVGRLADPTAMLVAGDDAIVVEPNAVSVVAVGAGTTRWRTEVADAEPFVAADATSVVVATTNGYAALDRATGAPRWRHTLEDPRAWPRSVALVATETGPIAVGTTREGGISGLDATTGVLRWSATVEGSPRGQLVGDDRSGAVALLSDRGPGVDLRVLDVATGTQRWAVRLPLGTGMPVGDGTRLMVITGTSDRPGVARAYAWADGTLRWEAASGDSSEANEGGTVDGADVVFVDGVGTVTAFDRRTGTRRWSTDLPMPVFHGRPVVYRHAVLLRDISGGLQVLDRRTGRRTGEFRMNGIGVGLGAGPAGMVLARSGETHHQVVGLPDAMTTMRTVGRTRRPVGLRTSELGATRHGYRTDTGADSGGG